MKGAQLWKRILNEGAPADPLMNEGAASEIQSLIIRAPIIVGPRLEMEVEVTKEYEWARYNHLSIPFPSFWCEWEQSDRVFFGHLVEFKKNGDKGWACALTTYAAANGQKIWFVSWVRFGIKGQGEKLLLLPDGSIPMQAAISEKFASVAGVEGAKEIVFTQASVALDLMMTLGCKNVSLKPNDNDPDSIRRAIKRHGGTTDSYRYHTLVVRPPGARLDAPAQDIGIMPRHVCRGHFAEYGPEFGKGLLFGKHAGRFYIPPHLKGDKKNGTVEKDYMIPAGEVK